ncbi:MAG: hypothetical protein IT233_02585 [Bacteroidia bacterium]|nr:hypothetical protein [Bacteroidia bacterium]
MRKRMKGFAKLIRLKPAMICLSFVVFTSFNSSDIKTEIPDDLDREKIIFSKGALMNANKIWAYKEYKDELNFAYKKCINELKKYPFKYLTV